MEAFQASAGRWVSFVTPGQQGLQQEAELLSTWAAACPG